ncbi:MAG: sulfatase-like hydrolase/transferase [Cyclobacteriaceae bacterium]
MNLTKTFLLALIYLNSFLSLAQKVLIGKDKPNIILILTDDQRFNTISALGNDEIETPNLDKLVKSGTTFTQAHIMGGAHPAVCMPSRAMLMTGKNQFSLESYGANIPANHITIGEHLQKQGYFTAHVGKWHNDRQSHHRSFNTAKKIFGMSYLPWKTTNAHWHTPVYDFKADGNYDPSEFYHDPPLEDFTAPYEHTKSKGRHSSEVFTDGAIEFISERQAVDKKDKKPFFLYLAHVAPHDPRQYPAELAQRFTKEKVSLPENFMTIHPFDNGEMKIRDELLLRSPRFEADVKQEIADYYAIIFHLDKQIGRLFNYLESTGLDRNTIIILAGDNGLALGQHGLVGKQNVYEHSVRVPLIISGPGIPMNEKRDQFSYIHDIFPTVCEIIGTDIPETVESKSLLSIIQESKTVRKDLYFAYRDVQRSIKDEKFKLIEYVVPNKNMYLPPERKGEFITTTQLFDLSNDPLEMKNLAKDPRYREKLLEMRQKLREASRKLNDNNDQGMTFWNNYNPK